MSESRRDFYVYEHWRPDLDLCFWVGKGTGDRAYRFKRNRDYDQVIASLAVAGSCAEVRLVRSGLTEWEALLLECERISFWTNAGIALTNRYGVGARIPSEETREKIRLIRLGTRASAKTRAKMSETHRRIGSVKRLPQRHGYTHTLESRAKMGARNRGKIVSQATREKLRLANLGKTYSVETRALISLKGKGRKKSGETLRRMSVAQKGHPVSAETRAKISATLKNRKRELV